MDRVQVYDCVCADCYRMVPAVRLTGYRCMTVYVLTVTEWYLQWDGLDTGVWLCMCWLLQNNTCSETDWVQVYDCVCAVTEWYLQWDGLGTGVWLCMCWLLQNGTCSETDWVQVYDCVCADCYRMVPAVRQTGYRRTPVYVLTVAGWYPAVRWTGYWCMTLSLIVYVLCGRMLCSRHWRGQNSSCCLNTLCASTSMLATGDLVFVVQWQFHILHMAMCMTYSHFSMAIFLGVTFCLYPMFTVQWQAPEVTMLVFYLHSIPLRICLSW